MSHLALPFLLLFAYRMWIIMKSFRSKNSVCYPIRAPRTIQSHLTRTNCRFWNTTSALRVFTCHLGHFWTYIGRPGNIQNYGSTDQDKTNFDLTVDRSLPMMKNRAPEIIESEFPFWEPTQKQVLLLTKKLSNRNSPKRPENSLNERIIRNCTCNVGSDRLKNCDS